MSTNGIRSGDRPYRRCIQTSNLYVYLAFSNPDRKGARQIREQQDDAMHYLSEIERNIANVAIKPLVLYEVHAGEDRPTPWLWEHIDGYGSYEFCCYHR